MTVAQVLVVEHERDAGIGFLEARFQARDVALHTVGPERKLPVPESLDGYDGVIVLGGSMGPTDDHIAPWLPATRALLAESVERGIPTLAVCLGAQLLATAMGGEVREAENGPEIGLCKVQILGEAYGDPLFDELRDAEVPTLQWHWLEVASLPPGAILLASSGDCRHQAFRLGTAAWGVQFHPEALTQTAADWFAGDTEAVERLGYTKAGVIGGVCGAELELQRVWGGLADRFAGVVLKSTA